MSAFESRTYSDFLYDFRREFEGSLSVNAAVDWVHNQRSMDIFMDIFQFLDFHYAHCIWFNGFSIARPDRRTHGNQDVYVGCSCGESAVVPVELWHRRLSGVDLEDIIEDLNYKRREGPKFNAKNMLEQEINKIKMKEAMEVHYKSLITQDKKGRNAILGLEVEES